MKTVINQKLIDRNKKLSMVLFFSSMAVLIFGAYLAWPGKADISRTMYSWIALMVGFVLTRISICFTARFGQTPRYDEVIGQAIEKLRSEYTYFVYSTPVPMLILGPCRLWLPILVTSSGTISYIDGKWKHTGISFIRRLMGQEAAADPDKDVAEASLQIEKQFGLQGIPLEEQPQIQPVVVVLLKNTFIGDVNGAPYPVVTINDLKRFIRKMDRESCENPIAPEENGKIITALTAGKM
ncbi:MAG: hypothetical protein AAGU15_10360 [Anaerolineaceae bacterium]